MFLLLLLVLALPFLHRVCRLFHQGARRLLPCPRRARAYALLGAVPLRGNHLACVAAPTRSMVALHQVSAEADTLANVAFAKHNLN